jgi:hypothetical protein
MRFAIAVGLATVLINGPARAGTTKDTVDAARAAFQDAAARGPAASASEIPALAKLLEKAGWTPTPELSGVFKPGSIFAVSRGSHALLASDCVSAEPEQNTYTSAEIVSSMQAGVSVRPGLISAGVTGGIVKKVKFGTPVHLSVPSLDLQINAACFARLQALPEGQRAAAYVVREVLRAEIAEQTCGRIDAQGRMVGLGAAEAELAAACAQESLEPVGVGYRVVPLNEVLEKGAAPEPTPAATAEAVTNTAPVSAATPELRAATGPFAIVFTTGKGACTWTVEDLPTGRSTNLFASSRCPTELVWDGKDELYYRDGASFYLLRAGKLSAEEVPRPTDAQCGAEDMRWLEPRLDRKTGEVSWACWVEADSTVPYTAPFRGDPRRGQVEMEKHCIGDLCAEGGSGVGVPIVIKDHAYDPDTGWRQAGAHADCEGADGCWTTTDSFLEGPLAPPVRPVNGMVTKSMIEALHAEAATAGCESLPEELARDPSLEVLLGTGAHATDDYGEREYTGCPVAGAGFMFWTRYWATEDDTSGGAYGPLGLCDASCRRRKVIDLPNNGIDLQMSGKMAVAGPNAAGSMVLVDVAAQDIVREWRPGQVVLVLPEGTATPLGIVP